MQLSDRGGQVAARPAPNPSVNPGWINNDLTQTTPPTIGDPDMMNGVLAEIKSVLDATGQTPSKTNVAQLLTGIRMLTASVVAGARNVKMSVVAASASATASADEIVVKTALGGAANLLGSFTETINLAVTGAGGMDTGSAPASGFVALYAIFNPATATGALLATNATAAAASAIYAGANMPSGYTCSALVSVWPTNASKQLVPGFQNDRTVSFAPVAVLSTAATFDSWTPLSIAGAVPANARSVAGTLATGASVAGAVNLYVAADAGGSGLAWLGASATGQGCPFALQILTPQEIFFKATDSAGVPSFQIDVSSYQF